MKYFIDTEFLEGTQDKKVLGFTIGKTKPTIDLISIGIVAEDGREYYAISKDFNLKEAWNRYDEKVNMDYTPTRGESHYNPMYIKEYWIRDNVLKPIYYELIGKDINFHEVNFTYKDLKKLLDKYGKSNKQIAKEIKEFVYPLEQWRALHNGSFIDGSFGLCLSLGVHAKVDDLLEYSVPQIKSPKFYGYFADYDWVVFCWLFGKMIDLPKGFPMYCIDLNQILNEKVLAKRVVINAAGGSSLPQQQMLDVVKADSNYPKQTNEHNALSDARWNFELYKFLKTL